ncbi:histidine kinase [Vallitalea pronyensis]|uniref:histidine kinase n=1 Tax=Vallitalea pronyensis TaxID=1348613 RepID=A0A8J8MH08_9FIRM|nr:sensor histidine kinase [Vallitalea pronyensis]QUI21647.1 histidine kinase [Vallitalea pronyensis]
MLKKLSVRNQLILFLLVTIILVLVMQIYSYFRGEKIIQHNVETYTHNVMTQMSNNVNTVLARIKKSNVSILSNTYIQDFLQEKNPSEKIELDNYIAKFLYPMLNANKDIASILLVDEDGKFYRYVYNEEYVPEIVIYQKLVKKYRINDQHHAKRFFSTPMTFGDDIYYCYVAPVYIFDTNKTRKKIGDSIIVINATHWKHYFNDILFAPDYQLLIVDENNQLVFSNGTDDNEDMDIPYITSQLADDDRLVRTVYHDKNIILNSQSIEETGWKIISLIYSDTLFQSLRKDSILQLTLGIGLFFLLLIIGITIIRNFTKPINEVLRTIKMIGKGKTKKKIVVKPNNEIKIIADAINHMMDNIRTMQTKIFNTQQELYEMELKKKFSEIQYKQAELSALQSQINPHFLYNTLDCIKSIGLVYDIEEIVQISSSMSDIFRYSIKGKELVTIEEEIACISNYLQIMSIRFMEKFTYTMNMDDQLYPCKIIKMILQPIVENSIFHGLEPKKGHGHLQIKGKLDNDIVTFTISDNGIGMKEEELKKLIDYMDSYYASNDMYVENTGGLGVANINKRIKTFFGDAYGVWITSTKDIGTTVTVLLPKQM